MRYNWKEESSYYILDSLRGITVSTTSKGSYILLENNSEGFLPSIFLEPNTEGTFSISGIKDKFLFLKLDSVKEAA